MKNRAIIILAVAGAAVVAGGGAVSAGAADDQAAAEAAIAAFHDEMLGLEGLSNGAQDTTEGTPEEIAADSPGLDCIGDSGIGLDARGRFEGETARSFSDNFTLPAPGDVPSTDPAYYPGGEDISAGIVTLDEDHLETLDELIGSAGDDDVAQCIEDAFQAFADAEAATADTTGGSVPPTFEVDVAVGPDLGVGDASAQFTLSVTTTIEGAEYRFDTSVYLARVDRSIVILNVSSESLDDESVIDRLEVLGALVASI